MTMSASKSKTAFRDSLLGLGIFAGIFLTIATLSSCEDQDPIGTYLRSRQYANLNTTPAITSFDESANERLDDLETALPTSYRSILLSNFDHFLAPREPQDEVQREFTASVAQIRPPRLYTATVGGVAAVFLDSQRLLREQIEPSIPPPNLFHLRKTPPSTLVDPIEIVASFLDGSAVQEKHFDQIPINSDLKKKLAGLSAKDKVFLLAAQDRVDGHRRLQLLCESLARAYDGAKQLPELLAMHAAPGAVDGIVDLPPFSEPRQHPLKTLLLYYDGATHGSSLSKYCDLFHCEPSQAARELAISPSFEDAVFRRFSRLDDRRQTELMERLYSHVASHYESVAYDKSLSVLADKNLIVNRGVPKSHGLRVEAKIGRVPPRAPVLPKMPVTPRMPPKLKIPRLRFPFL